MPMITDEKGLNELMIDTQSGRLFKRELTREEEAHNILSGNHDANIKLSMLQRRGFDLEDILHMALNFKE